MKKVIGVALAASLVAGMAFADVAVTLNARVRSNMYHQKKLDSGDKTTTTFDLSGEQAHGGSGTMSDVLGFKASTDYAGVVLDIAANRDASAADSKTQTVYYPDGGGALSIQNSGTDKSVKVLTSYTAAGESFSFDGAYYGWMKFGGLKLTFGTFDSRFVNRYNTSAGESGLLDSDYAKYGLAALNGVATTRMKDANNLTAIGGNKSNTVLADYTIDDVAGGKLLLKAGLTEYKYTFDESDASSKKYQTAGYLGEAAFQNDSVKLQALVKVPTAKSMVFGVYAEPTIAKEFPLAFGFTYGKDSDDYSDKGKYGNSKNNKFTGYAFDARIGYLVNDQLKISTLAKYENVKLDTADSADTALSLGAEVSYIVNDLATVFADVRYVNADLDGKTDSAKKDDCTVSFRPGVVLNAGAGARVTAAFQYDNHTKTTKDEGTKTEWSIPVIFRAKL